MTFCFDEKTSINKYNNNNKYHRHRHIMIYASMHQKHSASKTSTQFYEEFFKHFQLHLIKFSAYYISMLAVAYNACDTKRLSKLCRLLAPENFVD